MVMNGGRNPWGGDNTQLAETGAPEGETDAPDREAPADDGPRSPWKPTGEGPPRRSAGIEDIFRPRGGGKPGGSGGPGWGNFRLPERIDGGGWLPLLFALTVLLWLLSTTYHQLASNEEGVVTTFGQYVRKVGPGVSFTLPWPVQHVSVADVASIRRLNVPENDSERLLLTSDQNLVDLGFVVRWNIKDIELYDFQLDKPEQTVREVAEAAMRGAIAGVPLDDVLGSTGRAGLEQAVRTRMQAKLDSYRSGVAIQGIEIRKANPPAKVSADFEAVGAARQDAARDKEIAEKYAQSVITKAQGEAGAFDRVYAQYKLAPELTRRRMYYETMEKVLSQTDKVIVGGNTSLALPEIRHRAPDQAQPAEGQ